MSGSDSNWILGTIIAGSGLVVSLLTGAIARDRTLTRLIGDGDEKLHERINRGQQAFAKEIDLLRSEFNSFRLEAAREFASHTHLKDLEERLTKAIERVDSRLEDMPRKLAKEIIQALKEGGGIKPQE
jgi:SMC interacting uncharacterized protein involved in chromosome segregation